MGFTLLYQSDCQMEQILFAWQCHVPPQPDMILTPFLCTCILQSIAHSPLSLEHLWLCLSHCSSSPAVPAHWKASESVGSVDVCTAAIGDSLMGLGETSNIPSEAKGQVRQTSFWQVSCFQ